jgi:tetratricopeptide (TPR) repeat protein
MVRPAILALVLVLSASAAAAQDQAPPDPERLFARALELQRAGDTLGAIDNYRAVLTLQPDRIDAMSNLGAAYVKLGQFEQAVAQYQAALKQDSFNATVRFNLALAYYKSGRIEDAIPQLTRVVSSNPDTRGAYLVLADCYLQRGQDREVVALLQPREQMFEGDLAFDYMLGTALLHLDNATEGQKYVDRIFSAGESAEGHLLMGIAHLSRQDFENAKMELAQAIKLNPALPTAHSLYGRTMLAMGDQETAAREFRKELQINGNDFYANVQLANLQMRTQHFSDAGTYIDRAVAIRPADLTARKLLANLRLQTGKVDEAVALFESIVKETPDAVDVHVQLATGYNRLKRKADADREREIIDRLNAQAQAKAAGKDK